MTVLTLTAGHTPGSVGLHDTEGGVLVTGDTLYATDHGLIDWYPASRSHLMLSSVEKILHLLSHGSVKIVLTGHNDVISSETAKYHAVKYIEDNTVQRRIRKSLSRQRANVILGANAYFKMPECCKEWIAN